MAQNGVKKISEKVIKQGRSLIINEEDIDLYDWDDIPDGSLKINPNTGLLNVKLKGSTDWTPVGIKNDGTLCIAKDSMIIEETFTIVNNNDGNGYFTYKNKDGNHRHMPLTKDGFVFELEEGQYIRRRNHLSVTIDDVLTRSATSGGVIELSEKRFSITDPLENGQEITARYIRIFRIGNPYPRIFMDSDQPEAAEVGDLWIDFDGTLADADILGEDIEIDQKLNGIIGIVKTIAPNAMTMTGTQEQEIQDKVDDLVTYLKSKYPSIAFSTNINKLLVNYCNGKIPWEFINHPTTTIGYGITDSYSGSWQNHTHSIADIANLDATINSKIASTTSVTNLGGIFPGNSANRLLILDSNGKIPAVVWNKNVAGSSFDKFYPGMIIDWYGTAANVPAGWAICDGTNGTPDLRDKFIIGAGKSYLLNDTGGKEGRIIATENLPAHEHVLPMKKLEHASVPHADGNAVKGLAGQVVQDVIRVETQGVYSIISLQYTVTLPTWLMAKAPGFLDFTSNKTLNVWKLDDTPVYDPYGNQLLFDATTSTFNSTPCYFETQMASFVPINATFDFKVFVTGDIPIGTVYDEAILTYGEHQLLTPEQKTTKLVALSAGYAASAKDTTIMEYEDANVPKTDSLQTGQNVTLDTRPQYYALYKIMKL